MARRPRRFALLFTLLFAPLVARAEAPARAKASSSPAQGKHFLWRVEQPGGGHLYLLGSVHLGRPDLYPLPRAVEAAFEEAKVLVVEADVEKIDQSKVQALTLSTGLLQDGSSLADHISKPLWASVQRACTRAGLPEIVVSKMRPWLAAVTLMGVLLKKAGISSEEGIERHLLERARGKKQIGELESVEAQLRLFASFDDAQQAAFLAYTLEDVDHLTRQTDELLDAWKHGDTDYLEGLLREIREKKETRPIYDVLFRDRNTKMVGKLLGYLKRPQVHLVVVGAAHLVGQDGLVAALKKRGLRITRL